MDDAESCRKRAREAADIADKITHPLERAAWQKVALEWLKLAEAVETRREK
jgi:hypothetical protein